MFTAIRARLITRLITHFESARSKAFLDGAQSSAGRDFAIALDFAVDSGASVNRATPEGQMIAACIWMQ